MRSSHLDIVRTILEIENKRLSNIQKLNVECSLPKHLIETMPSGSSMIDPSYQYKTIEANKTDRVFYYDVPNGYDAIITAIANETNDTDWTTNGSYFLSLIHI